MITGKTMYLWIVRNVEGGNPQRIAERAADLGLTAVFVKAAQDHYSYNLRWPTWTDTVIGPLIDALAQKGIACWGWQYVTGRNPEKEAQKAAERMGKYPFTGWVINAEAEYKAPGMAAAARRYMGTLRNLLPGAKIGLTTYRYPNLHPEFPWAAFFSGIDFLMPQVYWMKANNPAQQLQETLRQHAGLFKALRMDALPIYPIGAAFAEHGWVATAQEVAEFTLEAQEQGLQGVSYWEWANAVTNGLDETISSVAWAGPAPQPEEPPVEQPSEIDERLTRLEAWARERGYDG